MKAILFLLIVGLIATARSCNDLSAKNAAANTKNGFAVVELFTSEGCSSCPPADAAVAKLFKKYDSNVYVLGYHVDYWDNLGWKDIFSNAAYTQIQRNYAKKFKLSSVYTPQVVVNGTEQFVGSDESKLEAAVDKSLQQKINVELNVAAKRIKDNQVRVHYSTNTTNARLNVALVQLHAENKIQRGENSGATLHHVNIVRDFKTVDAANENTVVLKMPGDLSTDNCRIIAFTQNINDNKITVAAQAIIH